jgi:hypothetical protein
LNSTIMKRTPFVLGALLMLVVMGPAQTQRKIDALSVQGCPGKLPVLQFQGREFVDLQELARMTNGSLSFERDRVILTLPGCDASKQIGGDSGTSGFSRPFMKAAIEAMASIREWGGTLLITVQNGYPVANTMAGNTIAAYQARAADNVALASAATSTDSDQRGLELLRSEFNNVQAGPTGSSKLETRCTRQT